jgi:uncharacterized membrane protein
MENNTNSGAVKAEGKNIMAIFSYLWLLIVIPLLTDSKNDPFVKFHLKQGLALIVFEVCGWIVGMFPVIGWLVGALVWLMSLVFTIIGIINVLNGQEKELPVIGQYAKNFKI